MEKATLESQPVRKDKGQGPVRAGIVGGGFMGSVHARSIRTAGGEIVGIVSSTLERSEEQARILNAGAGFGSIEALLAEGLDVLHVCTPNALHAEGVSAAIEAGVNVVCEKPLAISAEEARGMLQSVTDAGLVGAVPFVYRFYDTIRTARSALAEPGRRAPWLLHGSYLQDWLADVNATNWRVDASRGGRTRAFGDIGVHWCDLAEFVTGQRITKVSAVFGRATETRPGPNGHHVPVNTEDGAVVQFETDARALGALVVSQASPGRKNRLSFSFDGDESFAFNQEEPERLWVGGLRHSREILRDPSQSVHAMPGQLPAGHPQGYYECFADFVWSTYQSLSGVSVDGLPTFADGLRSAILAEAVVESAETMQWVDVEPITVPAPL